MNRRGFFAAILGAPMVAWRSPAQPLVVKLTLDTTEFRARLAEVSKRELYWVSRKKAATA